jgi:thioredoxin 1
MKIKVIDFWAEWCGPCRVLSPIIDELKVEYATNDDLEIIKINVDDDAEASVKYGIRSLPTLVFINNETGEVLEKIVGAKTKAKLIEIINEKLG